MPAFHAGDAGSTPAGDASFEDVETGLERGAHDAGSRHFSERSLALPPLRQSLQAPRHDSSDPHVDDVRESQWCHERKRTP